MAKKMKIDFLRGDLVGIRTYGKKGNVRYQRKSAKGFGRGAFRNAILLPQGLFRKVK
jgi:hypothetical protein